MVLQQAMLERKDEADIARCKEDLLCQHVSESLKKYVEWSDQLKDGVNDAHSTREFTATQWHSKHVCVTN